MIVRLLNDHKVKIGKCFIKLKMIVRLLNDHKVKIGKCFIK